MIRRPLELLALSGVAGAVAAAYGAPAWGAVAATMAGAVAWVGLDTLRVAPLLRWLREGRSDGVPTPPAVWGEIADRARKSLRVLEQERDRSEERLQDFLAAIQASPNGVVLLNSNESIEWCNQTAAEHFGIDPVRDRAQLIRNLIRDPVFIAYMKSGNHSQPIEIVGRDTSGGHPKKISLQIHPYGNGRQLMLTRDITAIEMAETMRRDFVANVSHEIRTPLTVLSGFVETLMSLPLSDEERQRYLILMSQQAQRMQTLVADLLTLSKLEGGPAPTTSEWVSAADLLLQAVGEAKSLADVLEGHTQDIEALPCPPLELAGARSELLSALSNLLNNAVRYTPEGGQVRAKWVMRDDGGAEFVVSDTGPGIAAEHLPRLTERFYRVDRSRSRETGGTGLGLAIVKHVAQRHGGQIKIESVLGKGSIFRIILPAGRVRLKLPTPSLAA